MTATTTPAPPTSRPPLPLRHRLRRWVQRLHFIFGVTAGLIAVSMGLSGTILAFRSELDRALNPGLFHVTPQGTRHSLDEMAAIAVTALPGGAIRKVTVPFRPDEAFQFVGKKGREAFVDPYSGQLLGTRDGNRTLVGWALRWHQAFGAGETGNRIVGWGAVGMLIVLLSGVWVALPIRRPFFRRRTQRPSAGSGSWKARIYAYHRQIGLVTGGFLLVMAYTGSAFVYRDNLLPVYGWLTGTNGLLPTPHAVPRPQSQPLHLDQATARARTLFPTAAVSAVHFPDKPDAPLRIVMRQPGEAHPLGKTLVYIDPTRGTILDSVDALTAPAAWRMYYAWNYPIHTGEIGGMPTRLLILALSPMPAVLYVTGFLIWRNKRRKA